MTVVSREKVVGKGDKGKDTIYERIGSLHPYGDAMGTSNHRPVSTGVSPQNT